VNACQQCDGRTAAYLCADCALALRDSLVILCVRSLDGNGVPQSCLLDELRMTATHQARISENVGGPGAEIPLPFHIKAMAHLRGTTSALHRWAFEYGLGNATDPFSADIRRASSPYGYGQWLIRNIIRIMKFESCGQFAIDVEHRIGSITRIIDRPPVQWFAGPCPECGADLYGQDGKDVVKCRECSGTFDRGERRDELLAMVTDVLATAAEISRATHLIDARVTPVMLTHWHHRGRLPRRGANAAGDALYRMGDVLAVINERERRHA